MDPQGSSNSLLRLSLDNWTDKLHDLYHQQNERRLVPEIYLSISEFVSKIAEAMRKAEFAEAERALAHAFCWLCALVNSCTKLAKLDSPFYLGPEISFSTIVAQKFPGVCGRCLSRTCRCGLDRMAVEEAKDKCLPSKLQEYQHLFAACAAAHTLEDWSMEFYIIFGQTVYQASLENITLHLMEEVGEVARKVRELTELCELPSDPQEGDKALRLRDRKRSELMGEIADVFSWMNSLSIKLGFITTGLTATRSMPSSRDRRADDARGYLVNAIINVYQDPQNPGRIRCPRCGQNPCGCSSYSE